jgi:hypothetical protein
MKAQTLSRFIFFCLLTAALMASGQNTNEKIKSEARNNRQQQSGGEGLKKASAGNSSAGFDFFFVMAEFTGFAFNYQKHLLHKEDSLKNERITNVEASLQAGSKPGDYYLFLPRIRGTWGFFSTDLRMYSSIEQRLDYLDFYKTFDWQILQLNFLATSDLNIRIGTGIMQDTYVKRTFPEYTLGASWYLGKDQYRAETELRYAGDTETRRDVRLEWNFNGSYRILSRNNLNIYLNLGGLFGKYYQTVGVWSILTGISLRID